MARVHDRTCHFFEITNRASSTPHLFRTCSSDIATSLQRWPLLRLWSGKRRVEIVCGFAGFIDLKRRFTPSQRGRIVRAMGLAIEHRGPDDWGVHDETEVGLALSFQRLSIIDLSAGGHQPMVSASGRSVLVFNGEINNASQISKELRELGQSFRGHSDTEVVIEAFERWGKSTPRCNDWSECSQSHSMTAVGAA